MKVLLLVSCSEYGLAAGDAGDTSGGADRADSASVEETAGETGDSAPLACEVQSAPAAARTGPGTCSALPPVDWSLVIEADHLNEVDKDSAGYIGSPAVLPIADGGPPLIVYQSWKHAEHGSVVLLDPVLGEVVQQLDELGDDGDPLAVLRDGSPRSEAVRLAVPTASVGFECAEIGGARTFIVNPEHGLPGAVDVTHDGQPELLFEHLLLDAETCQPLVEVPQLQGTASVVVSPVVFDASGDFDFAMVASEGITDLSTGVTERWEWSGSFGSGVIFSTAVAGTSAGELRVVVLQTNHLVVAEEDGTVLWEHTLVGAMPQCSLPVAVGNLSGDVEPEVVICEDNELSAFTLGGRRLWTVTAWEPHSVSGGWSLADLDADGRYEIVQTGTTGLHIWHGATGALLAELPEYYTRALFSFPVIADVDSDGSAEIVVPGDYASEAGESWPALNDHLFVIGPATGRWARTRPVWNQVPYDVTTVRDDGRAIAFPRPNWQTYNAFRAQPAHDGDHPDLMIEVLDVCVDTCGPGGTVRLAVQVSNAGSKEALAGARVTLSTWSAGAGVLAAATAVIPAEIPAGWSTDSIELEVPWEDWRDGRFIQVDGAHLDECDLVNDRVDVWVDPCG